jgi:short-subunit dehydrogenase involved in D-alanine esterification of teichoic acids
MAKRVDADDDLPRTQATSLSAEFPACGVLINNAGIMRNLNLNAERSLSDVTQEIDVSLKGPVRMVSREAPPSSRPPSPKEGDTPFPHVPLTVCSAK